jgi:hypothetical protein
MKTKILAVVLLLLTVGGVIANTVAVGRIISGYETAVCELEVNGDGESSATVARELFKKFQSSERFVSLTVNHDDLTSIEELFSELIGQLEVGDGNAAHVTKNRLIDALRHLGRLSGFNIDAIV